MFFQTSSGWWLGQPSEKYEFVNWDDWQPNISGKIKFMATKPPTSHDESGEANYFSDLQALDLDLQICIDLAAEMSRLWGKKHDERLDVWNPETGRFRNWHSNSLYSIVSESPCFSTVALSWFV